MNGYDKKNLEEAVEKVLKEREEKIRASMRTSPDIKVIPIKEEHLVKKTPPEKKKPMSGRRAGTALFVLLIVIITSLLIYMAWDKYGPEVEPEIVIVYPANVVLDSFNDGLVFPLTIIGQPVTIINDYDYVSVSFQLKNTGDEVAVDVSCFIKCCDQDGMILFAQMFTFDDIEPDMPGKIPHMRLYKVPISDEVIYVTHDIDVRWSPQGVNTYMKLTEM